MLLDVLLAAALTVLSVTTLLQDGAEPAGPLALLLAVLAVAPLALRQVFPVLSLVVVGIALVAHGGLGYGDPPSGGLGLVIAMFTVATLRPRHVAAAAFPVTVLVLVLSFMSSVGVTWTMLVQAGLICLCAWGLGDATRRWAEQAQVVAAEAERSVAQERTRIARELHDVVTHHMSVVALQTGLAEYVLDTDVAAARTAIGNAGDASREALQDLGRMLDALRADQAEAAPYDPQPGLGDLEGLLERLRSTGLDVRLRTSGSVRPLTAGAELCAYRVVQESLTNVLKHAGPGSRAEVDVTYGDQVLTVEVSDDGRGSASPAAGTGLGVRGMQERAELYGGVLEAGPAPRGGYAVRLRLPVGDGARPGAQAAAAGTAAP